MVGNWPIRQAQTRVARQFANFSFRQFRIQQRRKHVVAACGFLAGTKVSAVVGIHAVSDPREPMRRAIPFEQRKELILAVIAAGGVILRIGRILQLWRLHHIDGDALLGEQKQVRPSGECAPGWESPRSPRASLRRAFGARPRRGGRSPPRRRKRQPAWDAMRSMRATARVRFAGFGRHRSVA